MEARRRTCPPAALDSRGRAGLSEGLRKSPTATQWFEDPEVLDNNGARFIHWRKQPGNYVFPYDCDPSLATEYQQLDKPAGK